MKYIAFFLALYATASCSKDNAPPPPCIQVPERTINFKDSLMIINCNEYVLGVNIKDEIEDYTIPISDTLYLQFDSIGIFTLFYYNSGLLPSGPPIGELSIQIE